MTATRPSTAITIRPFTDADYESLVVVANACYPDNPLNADELRHEDSALNREKYFRLRVTAEDGTGRTVGHGELGHSTSHFDPQKYWLDVYVDPPAQRRGYGSAIYEHLLGILRGRGAIEARTAAQDTKPDTLSWLDHRGFKEARRSWESRLNVASFDFDPFANAEPRARSHGIAITTLAEEMARNRETALRRAFDLYVECNRDVPSDGEYTPPAYEDWIKRSIEGPDFLPDTYLIAKHGDGPDAPWVGMSALWRNVDLPDVLQQGLTGLLRDYRGRGIALALKVRGVRLAKERQVREVRTFNDTRNRPMLRINEAMGFAKQPAWIIFAKDLST